VIPTSEPDVKLDTHSVDYPFVTALLNQANRLKACIVAGKEMTLGLYLFKNYRPCSYGMWTTMQFLETARSITKSQCSWICVHPYARMSASSSDSSFEINDDIKSLLAEGAQYMPDVDDLRIPSVLGVELVLPPKGIPSYYLKGLAAEMLTLIRPAARYYMRCKDAEEIGLSSESIRLDFWSATVRDAMIAGEAVGTVIPFQTVSMKLH
jgi:hypothetical protein